MKAKIIQRNGQESIFLNFFLMNWLISVTKQITQGLLIDGIKSNFKTLEYLYEFAFENTKCSEFSKDEFLTLI